MTNVGDNRTQNIVTNVDDKRTQNIVTNVDDKRTQNIVTNGRTFIHCSLLKHTDVNFLKISLPPCSSAVNEKFSDTKGTI